MRVLNIVTLWLLIVGGLNWGMTGLLNVDLLAEGLGDTSPFSRFVYILIGMSALWQIVLLATARPGARAAPSPAS